MSENNIIATDRKAEKEASPLRLIMTLAIAGLISGVAIIGIYEATFATIAENRARELKEAVFTVLPGITRMQELVWRDGDLVRGEADKDEQSIYAGYNESEFFGYAIRAEGAGFQDTIVLLYGYKPDETIVVGMQILESRETPGLGDKIYKDEDFVNEFSALLVEPEIELIKGHGPDANQVDAITGATISSKAVVNIINKSNQQWLPRFPEGEPPGGEQ